MVVGRESVRVTIACRIGCGACCIAPSISSPLPGAPGGKRAGARCLHLTEENACRIHGSAQYPAVCRNFKPGPETCGASFEDAMAALSRLEAATRPIE